MSSGVGRGRGWLNLKNQNANAPGTENDSASTSIPKPSLNSMDNKNYSDASNDFTDVINRIKHLSVGDDGIKFNQKIKHIIEKWNEDCESAFEVEKSFEAIHQACLVDGDFAMKVVLLIASRTFLSQEIHEKNIRLMFVRKLQDNFENCMELQSSHPNSFRNSVRMLGEFFNKARLANGQQFLFMATPLISYLEMLLESTQSVDLKLFTMQLYLNGCSLKSECPEKIAELLSKVRLNLCSEKTLKKECKLWLLLSLEVANNRFALLPADIHNFYQNQLGDHAMAYFQGTHGTLTVQTSENNESLNSYQSNVNVLQVSTSSEQLSDSLSSQNNLSDGGSLTNYSSSGFHSDTTQNTNGNKKDHQGHKSGKAGRPILGAGARLNKNRNQNDSGSSDSWTSKSQKESDSRNWNKNRNQSDSEQFGTGNLYKNKSQSDSNVESNWRERDKRGNQSNQKKSGSGDWDKTKMAPKTSNKGWEHDDRFDTDYS